MKVGFCGNCGESANAKETDNDKLTAQNTAIIESRTIVASSFSSPLSALPIGRTDLAADLTARRQVCMHVDVHGAGPQGSDNFG